MALISDEDAGEQIPGELPDAQIALPCELEAEEDDALIIGPGGIPKTGLESSQPDPDRVNLKNGKAHQSYQTSIEGYSNIAVKDNGGAALEISPEGEVSGEAMVAGEYTLILEALKAGRPVAIRARLSIIADPRDLWKAIASDQQAPNAKVDEASDYCRSAEAFIVAASKRGRSHAQVGSYRDDDFSIRADTETGWHILIVADGAGSAELSREGSRIACEVVLAALPVLLAEKVDPRLQSVVEGYADDPESWALMVREELLKPVLPEAALEAARAIELEAAETDREPQEFSTTLVIAISKKVSDRWFTASFSVGDGGVAIFDVDKNEVAVICRPDSGEYAGQTRFLACSEFDDANDLMGRIFVDLRENFTVLAAMTDGVTDAKFPTDAALENSQIWSEFWAEDISKEVDLQSNNPAIQEQMLSWLDFWSRGNHDDRTIALMLPEQAVNECD
ncbi:hypothetical protein IMCC3135_03105 [Granulosicoccus antarcticus IMCC3135]|uniref:PPM-type phosphatase domain-containing protein n=2 Tax=Granulosicoccus TaxID=437504 RepID=A0A2Z2NUF7_9GAMM|nr:hypothetical protein IMCC3135_03105 [Granulosicoccus antarcticus IMCC3135]